MPSGAICGAGAPADDATVTVVGGIPPLPAPGDIGTTAAAAAAAAPVGSRGPI